MPPSATKAKGDRAWVQCPDCGYTPGASDPLFCYWCEGTLTA